METPVNPRLLLPDFLAEAVEHLGAELVYRTEQFPTLEPVVRERRFRQDVDFCARMLSIYKTIAEIQRRDPKAHPLDPAQFLPSHVSRGLAETENYLGELLKSWRTYDAHPTTAQFDAALKALSRIVALRRSAYDVSRTCEPPPDFPGWDADKHLNPFDKDAPLIRPEGAPEPPDPQELIDRILGRPEDEDPSPADEPEGREQPVEPDATAEPEDDESRVTDDRPEPNEATFSATKSSSRSGGRKAFPSDPSPESMNSNRSADTSDSIGENRCASVDETTASGFSRPDGKKSSSSSRSLGLSSRLASFIEKHAHLDDLSAGCRDVLTHLRSLRRVAAIPIKLLRRARREGAAYVYLRPYFRNAIVGSMSLVAGQANFDFAPPERPPEKMSEAEIAWWKAEEQRRIRIVFRPEVEGRQRGIPPPSLPPWGFDDPPWER